MPFDRANIMLYLPEEDGFRPFVRSGPKVVPEQIRKRVLPREGSMLGYVLDQKKPVIQTFDGEAQEGPLKVVESKVVQEALRRVEGSDHPFHGLAHAGSHSHCCFTRLIVP